VEDGMSFLGLLRARAKPSAPEAKERLQILLAHERSDLGKPDYLPRLHNEILQVIAKYVEIDEDKISVDFENTGSVSIIELNIEVPNRGLRAEEPIAAAV
jgi:cell division topological specificity factor